MCPVPLCSHQSIEFPSFETCADREAISRLLSSSERHRCLVGSPGIPSLRPWRKPHENYLCFSLFSVSSEKSSWHFIQCFCGNSFALLEPLGRYSGASLSHSVMDIPALFEHQLIAAAHIEHREQSSVLLTSYSQRGHRGSRATP